jgi:hypothetical protein
MTWHVCIADASVRAVALAAMAGVLAVFLRRNPAAEHALWTLVVVGMRSGRWNHRSGLAGLTEGVKG